MVAVIEDLSRSINTDKYPSIKTVLMNRILYTLQSKVCEHTQRLVRNTRNECIFTEGKPRANAVEMHTISNVLGMGYSIPPMLISHKVQGRSNEWGSGESDEASGAGWWYNEDSIFLLPRIENREMLLHTLAETDHLKQVQRDMNAKMKMAAKHRIPKVSGAHKGMQAIHRRCCSPN